MRSSPNNIHGRRDLWQHTRPSEEQENVCILYSNQADEASPTLTVCMDHSLRCTISRSRWNWRWSDSHTSPFGGNALQLTCTCRHEFDDIILDGAIILQSDYDKFIPRDDADIFACLDGIVDLPAGQRDMREKSLPYNHIPNGVTGSPHGRIHLPPSRSCNEILHDFFLWRGKLGNPFGGPRIPKSSSDLFGKQSISRMEKERRGMQVQPGHPSKSLERKDVGYSERGQVQLQGRRERLLVFYFFGCLLRVHRRCSGPWPEGIFSDVS